MRAPRLFGPLLAAACAGLLAGAAEATPGLTERVVSDPASGIALYGYDPVAYFTDGRPVLGRRDIEVEWGGAAWRFESEANRAAFLSKPEAYAPRYGGYDPRAVAILARPPHGAAVQQDLAGFRRVVARDQVDDRGLAAP
ncbi:YHS domain-containing (seleno)protein, partial [Hansschlegelia beijingensis]